MRGGSTAEGKGEASMRPGAGSLCSDDGNGGRPLALESAASGDPVRSPTKSEPEFSACPQIRISVWAARIGGITPLCPLLIDDSQAQPEPLSVNSFPWQDESDSGWIRIKTVMDSGASESVAPPKMAPGVAIE